MQDTIAVTGVIGNDPIKGATPNGRPFLNFRLASNRRKYNNATERWEDAGTNWYAVAAYGSLALNLAQSVGKGARVFVKGRLEINEWKSGDKLGREVQLVAESAGHDLTWGTAVFTRTATNPSSSGRTAPAGSDFAPVPVDA
jgi:single-strand DNA-binding protein